MNENCACLHNHQGNNTYYRLPLRGAVYSENELMSRMETDYEWTIYYILYSDL